MKATSFYESDKYVVALEKRVNDDLFKKRSLKLNINKITLKDCTECHKDLERFCSQMVFQLLLSSVFFKETESENRTDFLVHIGADSGEFQTGHIFKDKVLPLYQVCE